MEKDKKDVYENMIKILQEGNLTKKEIIKFSNVLGINYETIRNSLRAKLNEKGIHTKLPDFFKEAEEKELKILAPKVQKERPVPYV